MNDTPRLVATDRFNPFRVHWIGGQGCPFPLSIQWRRRDGVCSAHGTALRTYDVISALSGVLPSTAVVFNIGQASFIEQDNSLSTASRIAELQGVPAEVRDVSWVGMGSEPNELLVMDSHRLERFFSGWSLYDIDMVFVAEPPGDSLLDQIVLAVNAFRTGDPPILSQIDSAAVYFGGHDDCYFTIECLEERFLRPTLGRLLSLSIGSVLLGDAAECIVAEPPEALTASILGESDAWIGIPQEDGDGGATVSLTRGSWHLGEVIPHSPSSLATYHGRSRRWTLMPA